MTTRVTQLSMQRSTLANLQLNMAAMASLQERMSSGTKISVPSDDPAGTSDVLALRRQQASMTQYGRNADDATAWLTTLDSTLSSSLVSVRRARDLTVQGGNGALGAQAREALATEIEGVRDGLLSQANATYLGRTVFAGTSNAGVAFTTATAADGTRTYSYTGTVNGETPAVERRLGDDVTVRVDGDGAAVYGDGDDSVFALLDKVAAALRSPDGDPTQYLGAIDARYSAMLTGSSSVGARQNRVDAAKSALQSSTLNVTTQLGNVQDIDLAQVILDLESQQVAYQGALGATARTLQPTLLDFLQ